jgi:molybdopterin-guanine dinucleotide biosynthesis protein A
MDVSEPMRGQQEAFAAVVLAGDRGPGDPLVEAAGVSCKPLIPVGGTPMVLRVVASLEEAQEIGSIVLSGPPRAAVNQEEGLLYRIASGTILWEENQATPSASAYNVLKSLPDQTPVLLTTADHALLTAQIVDYFCCEARSTGADVVVGLARHDLVLRAYPDTRRTAIHFRDARYCSCNLFAFFSPRARRVADFWRKIEKRRKKTLRFISGFGWLNLLLYLLRRPSLEQGLSRISRRLGLKAAAVIMPFPEAAVDVDTVEDWHLVESIVASQAKRE